MKIENFDVSGGFFDRFCGDQTSILDQICPKHKLFTVLVSFLISFCRIPLMKVDDFSWNKIENSFFGIFPLLHFV